jgi:hypothetical protein
MNACGIAGAIIFIFIMNLNWPQHSSSAEIKSQNNLLGYLMRSSLALIKNA